MIYMVVVKFLVFVSEVVSIFSKILTWIIGGQKNTFAPPTQLLGGACPGCPPKSTPMVPAYSRALNFFLHWALQHSGFVRIWKFFTTTFNNLQQVLFVFF